ncbi:MULTISPECIES: MarR family transcriptional regulator [Kitasatospora]|uniref:Putative MarR family transcriptional regulator n=1 Tax=Kitasatospora setae (strain ATCC 33774 / DSM 43861 / JCM 3304 / KCC A-0304 / NBRC 14216 / KM-6054) TaxID=452652 RepID=E4N671_KITSK|nr:MULTISPECIES: MarR family transcriptional regulator [Kitasatospora]BAJ26702.1 putative MarR family transcriptional regulator [Kitasatospora setae KM-6054]
MAEPGDRTGAEPPEDGVGAADDGGAADGGDGAAADEASAAGERSAAGIAAAWQRERPGTPTDSIEIVTPIWRLAKLFADDRNRVLRAAGIDAATLDLLAVLRRAGAPYELTTRELTRRTLVTAGAISQRVARAEREGLVRRCPDPAGGRAVLVALTPDGHALVERSVDAVLGREAALVTGLSATERGELSGLLDRLLTDLRGRIGPTD